MVSVDDDTRDRGILTTSDREYLRGESDITEETAVNKRVNIRDRIRHSLADFELLTHNLTPKDRKLLFKDDAHRDRLELSADGVVAGSRNRGEGFLENVMIFVYMVCRDWGLDFEALIQRAVKKAETSVWLDGQFQRRENVYDAGVSVELRQDQEVDVDRAMQRFEDGQYLSNAEIGALIKAEKIDGDDLPRVRDESSG